MRLLKRGRHYKKPALWKRILKWTALSVLILILIVGLAGSIFAYRTLGKMGDNTQVVVEAQQQLDIPPPDQPENILVMGTDEDPDGNSHRSDSMMLVRVNPQGKCLSILSIPRDLIVNIPGVGQDKINAAYAIGGVPLAIDTVRKLTGEPIHHFVTMNFTGFSQAVDALGGIYVDVDKRYFNDNSDAAPGEAYDPIDVYPGYQKLNGKDALAYVRFRHTDSDFMRIKRQQYFLRDAKAQSMTWSNITKIPELADIFASNTTSDLGRGDALSMTKFLLGLNRDHIYQGQIAIIMQGENVLLDKSKLTGVISQFESPTFSQPAPAVPGEAPAQVPSDQTKKLSVEVMNGSGVAGSANLAANLLTGKGMTAVTVSGNANNHYTDNEVYYQPGNQPAADELSTLLKPCKAEPMPAGLSTSAQLLIVVGDNFKGQLTEDQPAASSPIQFQDNSTTGQRSWQAAASQLPFPVEKPASFPASFDYADFHPYEIETDDGPKPALKVVATDQSGETWGIMETTFTSAPLLDAPSVQRQINGKTYNFYYVDDRLRCLAWQDGDAVYWITNSLQNSLSEDTMVKLAVSFKQV